MDTLAGQLIILFLLSVLSVLMKALGVSLLTAEQKLHVQVPKVYGVNLFSQAHSYVSDGMLVYDLLFSYIKCWHLIMENVCL